jgi:hypothetical protein
MKAIGMLTTAVVGVGVVMGAVLGLRSVPDVKRYLRMRSM